MSEKVGFLVYTDRHYVVNVENVVSNKFIKSIERANTVDNEFNDYYFDTVGIYRVGQSYNEQHDYFYHNKFTDYFEFGPDDAPNSYLGIENVSILGTKSVKIYHKGKFIWENQYCNSKAIGVHKNYVPYGLGSEIPWYNGKKHGLATFYYDSSHKIYVKDTEIYHFTNSDPAKFLLHRIANMIMNMYNTKKGRYKRYRPFW